MIYSNNGHVSYRFLDKRQLWSKSAQFSHSKVFNTLAERGFPCNFVTAVWLKNLDESLPDGGKS